MGYTLNEVKKIPERERSTEAEKALKDFASSGMKSVEVDLNGADIRKAYGSFYRVSAYVPGVKVMTRQGRLFLVKEGKK